MENYVHEQKLSANILLMLLTYLWYGQMLWCGNCKCRWMIYCKINPTWLSWESCKCGWFIYLLLSEISHFYLNKSFFGSLDPGSVFTKKQKSKQEVTAQKMTGGDLIGTELLVCVCQHWYTVRSIICWTKTLLLLFCLCTLTFWLCALIQEVLQKRITSFITGLHFQRFKNNWRN